MDEGQQEDFIQTSVILMCSIRFSLQGHPGLDGAKGETGAAGAKVWTDPP